MKTTCGKLRGIKALVLFFLLGLGFSVSASTKANSGTKAKNMNVFAAFSENDVVNDQALKTISGVVTDASGETLPGVNITVKGKAEGTQTDFDGNYVINVENTDTLVFSYVGFKTVEKGVGANTTLNVSLEEDASALNEVVVIGYGSAKKSDLAGAVAQLKPEAFEEQPITRVEDALQGRIAGVNITNTSGSPGADTKIRIRGINSITGANGPLVVVDGIFGGDLRTINPNDIASIEVLKDASALAIYGSRGANGVILISTKKGKGKPKVSVDYFTTVTTLRKKYEGRLSSAAFARRQNDIAFDLTPDELPFSESDINALQANPIDYEDELFRTAISQNVQASVSGGNDKFNYFISGNFADQEGIMITSGFKRYSLRSNLESKVNDKFTVGLNLYANREVRLNDPRSINSFKGGPTTRTLTIDPTRPLRNSEGGFNFGQPRFGNVDITNFIANLRRSEFENQIDRTNATLNLSYKLTDALTFTTTMGLSSINGTSKTLLIESDKSSLDGFNTDDSASANLFTTHTYQFTNALNWNKTFDKHNLDVLGVYEIQGDEGQSFNSNVTSIISDVDNVFDADNRIRNSNSLNVDYGTGKNAIQSYLGRVQYNFDSSIYVTASMRIDQSTRFLKSNQTGYFPSAAVAYSFKNWDFLENSDWINDIKVRGSWGQVGNQNISSSAFVGVFAQESADDPTQTGVISTVALNQIVDANPEAKWETTESIDAGLDFGFFNNRLTMSLDYYKKNTNDLLLVTRDLDNQNRANLDIFRTINIGEVQNEGFEVAIYGDPISTDNFTWTSGITFAHNENEVVKLNGQDDFVNGNVRDVSGVNTLSRVEEGEALGQFRGIVFQGLDENGEAIYETEVSGQDEDGNDILSPVVRTIGNGTPKFNWGFNNTFDYKSFDMNIFVQGVHGFDVYNQVAASLNGGTPDFRNNLLDSQTIGGNALNSSRYIEKGDFIRLSNASIGYTIENPTKSLNSVKFTLSGQNLFLITDYSGYDPEISTSGGNDQAAGIDRGGIPLGRSFSFGVKLDF